MAKNVVLFLYTSKNLIIKNALTASFTIKNAASVDCNFVFIESLKHM
jgi:hypothetical protein